MRSRFNLLRVNLNRKRILWVFLDWMANRILHFPLLTLDEAVTVS